jgi:thioredoxin-related protein
MKMKKTILIKILIINIFLIGQAFAQQNIELKNTKLDNKTINKTPVIIVFKNGNIENSHLKLTHFSH